MAFASSGTILYVAKISYQSDNWFGSFKRKTKILFRHTDTHTYTHTERHTHTTHTHTHTHTEAYFISLVFLRKCRNKTKKSIMFEQNTSFLFYINTQSEVTFYNLSFCVYVKLCFFMLIYILILLRIRRRGVVPAFQPGSPGSIPGGVRKFNFCPGIGVFFVCVLSCVVFGRGPDIMLITHSGRPAPTLVYLSRVLVQRLLLPLQAPDPGGFGL